MTVHELIQALRVVPNQNLTVTVTMWTMPQEILAVRIGTHKVELDWRKEKEDE